MVQLDCCLILSTMLWKDKKHLSESVLSAASICIGLYNNLAQLETSVMDFDNCPDSVVEK